MSRLEDLMKQKRAIEDEIKRIKEQRIEAENVLYHVDEFYHHLDIKINDSFNTRGWRRRMISAKDKEEFLKKIDTLIVDLQSVRARVAEQ